MGVNHTDDLRVNRTEDLGVNRAWQFRAGKLYRQFEGKSDLAISDLVILGGWG